MEEIKNEKSYWPHAIIGSILLIIGACVWTIVVALDNPVEMDSFYLEKYQKVDRNMNTILKKQKEFFKKYDVKYNKDTLKLGKQESISLSILDKQTKKLLQKAQISLLVTRPDTNKFNQELNTSKAVNGKFTFDHIMLNKPGRWQFKAKIKSGDLEGFHEYEALAVK